MTCLYRLLKERAQHSRELPRAWVDQLLGFACRPGQQLSDINRRSAGLPIALAAIFLAEPAGGHRVRCFVTRSLPAHPSPVVAAFSRMAHLLFLPSKKDDPVQAWRRLQAPIGLRVRGHIAIKRPWRVSCFHSNHWRTVFKLLRKVAPLVLHESHPRPFGFLAVCCHIFAIFGCDSASLSKFVQW